MTRTSATKPLLRVAGAHKRFGGVRALDGASFEVMPGEIHGLLGENGSGKSTLLKILSGQLRPDAGRIWLDGRDFSPRTPTHAIASGIVAVTQERTLVPALSVAENVLLGHRAVRGRLGIDPGATRQKAARVLTRLGFDVDPDAPGESLRPDEQQLVEVARAVSMDARVVLLDEPTSSLTDDDVRRLFAVVRSLCDHGLSIVFVSHKMSEIFELVDALTVLRNGKTADSGRIREFDSRRVIRAMVGHEPAQGAHATHRSDSAGERRLRVTGLRSPRRLHGVSLDVGEGEIVGLAGPAGAGRSEILAALFGLDPEAAGEIELDGRPVAMRDPRNGMAHGMAYVPPDRKTQGLALGMSVADNLMMARTSRTARVRPPQGRSERQSVAALLEQLAVRCASDRAGVGTLSGGNQQKVLLGKWFACEPKVLLLDEPTRGVDVGAKEQIHVILEQARDRGLAILLSSSENPELARLCDRVHVFHRGRIAGTLPREAVTDAAVARYAMGHA